MYQNIEAIALRMVRYNDRHSILSAYSREAGRLALLVPAGASASARRQRALLMPMVHFECVVSLSPGRDICGFRDLRPVALPPEGNVVRASLALFAADLLNTLLREPMPDEALFAYIAGVASRISSPALSPRGAANLPLALLIGLTRHMGIEPDWSTYTPGSVFDLADGIFRPAPPAHGRFISTEEASAAFTFRRMTPRTAFRFPLNRAQRNRALDTALRYYSLHLPTFAAPQSLDILRHTFDF